MNDDAALLRQYAETGSEPAFAEFVARHLGLVYGAALRRTGEEHRARDVAQVVFTDAARRSAILARHACIEGWLYTAARHAACNLLRAEHRRHRNEQRAHEFNAMNDPGPASTEWERLRPVLDAAMDELSGADRHAVLIRFFEHRPFAEVGARLRVSEHAARMRVDRAVERLRVALARRGVTSTAAALATVLADNAVAAPAGLAAGIAHAAISAAVTTGTTAGWLTFLTMKKFVWAGVGLLLAGAVVPPLLELRAHQTMTAELDRLRTRRTQVSAEKETVATLLTELAPAGPDRERVQQLAALRTRIAVLKARPEGVVDSEMKPPRNAGMGSPEATFETINWAINAGDWETFSRTFVLEGEAREMADKFFAGVRPDVRERYGTAERLLAHAWINGTQPHGADWAERIQVLGTEVADGGPGLRRVRIWQRTGTGIEIGNIAEFQYRPPDGWLISPGAAAKALRVIIPQLDPATGEFVPKPARKP